MIMYRDIPGTTQGTDAWLELLTDKYGEEDLGILHISGDDHVYIYQP